MKCIRSHILKMLYRYITVHEDLRNKCGLCNTITDFRDFVKAVRLRVEHENSLEEQIDMKYPDRKDKYWISWYNRHRYDVNENGETAERRAITDPDHVLNLKDSFIRGGDDQWEGGDCGGIFSALNMFGDTCGDDSSSSDLF